MLNQERLAEDRDLFAVRSVSWFHAARRAQRLPGESAFNRTPTARGEASSTGLACRCE